LTQCHAVVALYNEYRLARTRRRRSVITQEGERKRERERERERKREGDRKERRYQKYSGKWRSKDSRWVSMHVKKNRGRSKVRRGWERKRSRSTFALKRKVFNMTGAHARVGYRRDQQDIVVSELHLCSGNLLETLRCTALKR